MARGWIGIGIVAAAAAGCGAPRPPRPGGLPEEALWAGEPRKGCWIVIGSREGAVWNLQVFEPGGRRHPATRWRVQGYARTSLEPQEIQSFEGGALILNDGARMVPAS